MNTSTWVRRSTFALAGTMLALGAVTTVAHAAPGQGGGLRPLIESGVITKAQADDLKEEIEAVKEASEGITCSEARSTALATLVSRGVLTQSQADAIAAAKPAKPARQAPAAS
jgi:hypothetical protein